jgi:hypothetical protein
MGRGQCREDILWCLGQALLYRRVLVVRGISYLSGFATNLKRRQHKLKCLLYPLMSIFTYRKTQGVTDLSIGRVGAPSAWQAILNPVCDPFTTLLTELRAGARLAIETLLADAKLRRHMGTAGRSKVNEHYSLQVWGPRVAQMLRRVADEGRKA